MDRLVTFVCLHGAGKSRIAAALFNAAAPHGWHATSAGVEPQEHPSEAAKAMLASDPAIAELDNSAPRPLDADDATVVVAIDCDLTGTHQWRLANEWPDPQVLGELRTLTTTLIASLNVQAP